MPMPPETLKTLQDLDITVDGAACTQQQQDDNNTQHYEQKPTESHGRQPAQPLHPLQPTTDPHSAALQAYPSEQPRSAHIYPPLLDHPFAFDSDGTIPIDPGLLDARFDHPAASGHGGGGGDVPGFHQGHNPEHHWAAAPQPLSSVNLDSFMVSPTSLSQYNDPQATLLPGMSSFEPQISTTWSMEGSLPPTSTSRGPTLSSSMSLPSNSTPASSKSPSSPGKVGPGLNYQPPLAGEDFALTNYPVVQLEPRAGDQPSRKKRQTVGPEPTAKMSTERQRSHRNNSSPGFSTHLVAIAPAPITVAGTGDDNNENINKREGSSSSNNSYKHAEKTKTTTTAPTTTTTTTTTSNAGGPSGQSQPGPSTKTTTAPGHPSDPRARNREAANRCRAKSRVAVAELEATERSLGSEHEHLARTARYLRDEVLALKNELLNHGNCDDELIQQYLTNSARMVGSGGSAGMTATTTTAAAGTLPGLLPLQPPLPSVVTTMPPGPSIGGGGVGGVVGSSSSAVPSASPPRVLPALLPSTSSGGPGAGSTTTTTTAAAAARGRGSVGGQKP